MIDKQFSFCYGHRVWVQELEEEFCAKGDTKTKCRHYHGHEGLVHVFLESEKLNEQAMVTDFKHLGWLKNFIDDNLDHKFVLDINDPLFDFTVNGNLTERSEEDGNTADFPQKLEMYNGEYLYVQSVKVPGTDVVVGLEFDTSKLEEGPVKELYEGFFLVTFIPTSENLSRWLYHVVDAKMSLLDVKTSKIDWFETPKSRASYTANMAEKEGCGGDCAGCCS